MDALFNNVQAIIDSLEIVSTPDLLDTSYDVRLIPLGSLRLKIIELVYLLVKLNRP